MFPKDTMFGDQGFLGVNMRVSPRLLQAGFVSEAKNVRFRRGIIETRLGRYVPPWLNNTIGQENPLKVLPWSGVHGVGVFFDPDSVEYAIIAVDGKVYRSAERNHAVPVPLPPGVVIDGEVSFAQAFSRMLMFRGVRRRPLMMETVDDGFGYLVPDWIAGTYDSGDEVAWGPHILVASIIRVGDVVTVQTSIDHGYEDGQEITISGADQSDYNGTFAVTVIGLDEFTYQLQTAQSDPAGTIYASSMIRYYRVRYPGALSSVEVTDPGSGYTSIPDVSFVGGGGSGAIAVARMKAVGGTVGDAGSGFAQDEIIQAEGGISNAAATFRITMVGGSGEIQTIVPEAAGRYSELPINPATVVGGSGSGATLNVDWGVESIQISDYGDGFFTAPEIEFSSGGANGEANIDGIENTALFGQTQDAPATFAGETNPAWKRVHNIMPPASVGSYIQGRIVVASAIDPTIGGGLSRVDYLYASDVLDPVHTYFDQQFRVNQGSADEVVDLAKITENTLIIFKRSSVLALTSFVQGTNSELSANVTLQTLIPNYGISGKRAWTVVGRDMFFLAQRRGIVSLRQSEEGMLQGVELPISDAMQPMIDRINWKYADQSRLAYWDNKLYAAVPIDDSSLNTHILVYDFINQAWSGYDTETGVVEFFKMKESGVERLFIASSDGYFYQYEELWTGDQVFDSHRTTCLNVSPIESMILSRGYGTPDSVRPVFYRDIHLDIDTWAPRFSLSMLTDGVLEEQSVALDQTRDRRKYTAPFNRQKWILSNENDDHGSPYREDYSLQV